MARFNPGDRVFWTSRLDGEVSGLRGTVRYVRGDEAAVEWDEGDFDVQDFACLTLISDTDTVLVEVPRKDAEIIAGVSRGVDGLELNQRLAAAARKALDL